ncbi:hypothetical protein P7C00_14390 [Pseudomonas sp. JDS08PS003]|uniref:hypothetical protein n=1 Tax=Pseudomonas TaxID=286 RepID=UPI00385771FA
MKPRPLVWILFIWCFQLGGCAYHSQAITDFSAATLSYSDAAKKLITDASNQCRTSHTLEYLGQLDPQNAPGYNPSSLKSEVESICQGTDIRDSTLNALADTLTGYAAALGKMSKLQSGTFDGSLIKLTDAAAKLNENKPSAEVKAGALLAESSIAFILQAKTKQQLKNMLYENHARISLISSRLEQYANYVYPTDMYASHGIYDNLGQSLKVASQAHSSSEAAARMPVRKLYAEVYALNEASSLTATSERVKKFQEATAAFIKAHRELMVNIDHLDTQEVLAEIKNFSDRASSLREAFNATKEGEQ